MVPFHVKFFEQISIVIKLIRLAKIKVSNKKINQFQVDIKIIQQDNCFGMLSAYS
jgi:hypothetical protein